MPLKPGSCKLKATNNGDEISKEIADRVFEPFFTTKASGSGLGLALVAKIVNDHGGVIECESLIRRTTFRILMPMYRPDSQPDDQSKENN